MSYAVIQSSIPSNITAGESVSWKWSDLLFPATEWSLIYTLVKAETQIQFTAEADGSEHLVELTATTTAAYDTGSYSYQAHVSKDAERYKVDQGLLVVAADFATETAGLDTRSHAKRVLDAIEAVIENRATKTQLEQSVNGVMIKHKTDEELLAVRREYQRIYRKEVARQRGVSSFETLKPRFQNR